MADDFLYFTTARRSSRAALVASWLDGGKIEFYSSPRAVTSDAAITSQTLLATAVLPDPIGTVTDDLLEADAIANALFVADEAVTWCRFYDSSDVAIGDADCGVAGSGAFVVIDNAAAVTGGLLLVLGFNYTEQ